MGESRSNTPGALATLRGGVPSANAFHADGVAETRQLSSGTTATNVERWMAHPAGARTLSETSLHDHNSVYEESPPTSTTQLVFPQHRVEPDMSFPSGPPVLPLIQVTQPSVDFGRPPSRLSFTDSIVPLETPIVEESQNPFLNPFLRHSSLHSISTIETPIDNSRNPFRDPNSQPESQSDLPFDTYGGVILGSGAVRDAPALSPRFTVRSCKADVVVPPSPVDHIDRFLDLAPTSSSSGSSSVVNARQPLKFGQSRSFSPGPTSRADFPSR